MLKILLGFEDSKIAVNNILGRLRSLGIPYQTDVKYSKASIRDFIRNHPDYNTVLLKETVGGSKYTAEELAELADEREINIIIVLSSEHKGQPYMQTLYSAGIVNAIFQEGRYGGGSADCIVQLMLQKRNRKEARAYYGLDTIEIGMLSNEIFAYYYLMLSNREYGMHLIERYLFVASKLSPLQNADFLKRLPREQLEKLSNFAEFHQVLSAIKSVGADVAKELKIKKPKKFTSIESLPHTGPMIEANAGYDSNPNAEVFTYDGNEEADEVFDFGIGDIFENEESEPATDKRALLSEGEDSVFGSESILFTDEDVGKKEDVDSIPTKECVAGKKTRRVKEKKIKKEKPLKQKKTAVKQSQEDTELPSFKEGMKGRKSLKWLLWGIPLALIVLITIVLVAILIIYYVRY